MYSFRNTNYYTLPSAIAAAVSDWDSATFNFIRDHSLLHCPGFCPPTVSYLPYLEPFQQVSQMRRSNEEGDPNGSHRPLCNVADKFLANSMPASLENSSSVVTSISEHAVCDLLPTTYNDNNLDIVYDYMTTPGSVDEDFLKMSSSDSYPVESGLEEVHQHDPRMLRHLQIENMQQNFMTGCFSLPYHPSNNIRRSSSPVNPSDPEVLKSSNPASSSMCRIPAFSTVNKKPSFGLHLNSIASSMAPNSFATLSMKTAHKDCYNLQTNNNIFISSSSQPKNIESGMPNVVKPVSEYEASDHAPSEPDVNQVNHQKKRKNADENDGCKRCNCKKSRCLKLYCDCFAAGVYCACQGCFNKPVHVDTVVETRRQIESRNPIAFAPKVVQQYKTLPAAASNGNKANHSTPASARHKRGCNCRKSLCLKKYCECYQANVGCTIGCRCEDCQNFYGKKEDYKPTKDVVLEQKIIESYNATQKDQPRNSQSLAPSFLPTGSKSGGNQFGTTPSPLSTFEPFGIPVSTIHQSQIDVTSSTPSALGNSNNLICPENGGFPSTDSPQLPGSLTHIRQFNGVKVHYNDESDDTPDILKDNFNSLLNSANVRSPNKKRVSPPFNARGIERGSSSVPVMRIARKFILQSVSSSLPLMPTNDDGGNQTTFPPLMSCIDSNKPEDNDVIF